MRGFAKYLLTGSLTLLLSCKEERCSICPSKESALNRVEFMASTVETKANHFREGVTATIHCYRSMDDPASKEPWPGTPIFVSSSNNGLFIPYSLKELYLPSGVYDFYSFSLNSTERPIEPIKKGYSPSLKNGIDYLWAANKSKQITDNQTITFMFKHLCPMVEIEFVQNIERENYTILSLYMEAPEEGSLLKLSEGKITAASKLSKEYHLVNYNKGLFYAIILPLSANLQPTIFCYLENKESGAVYLRKAKLPLPAQGLEGGRRYSYKFSITNDSIKTTGCTIEEWQYKSIENIEIK